MYDIGKKYEILREGVDGIEQTEIIKTLHILSKDVTVYRIRALKDFGDVKAGDFGGFIESESNLSQIGNCWVYPDAIVCEDAEVSIDARIYLSSRVSGHAKVHGRATISGACRVYDYANISGNTLISDGAYVFGDSMISDYAQVLGNAQVYGDARACDHAIIKDGARVKSGRIFGCSLVAGHAFIDGATMYDNPRVYADVSGGAVISGNAVINENYKIEGKHSIRMNASICSSSDLFTAGPIGTRKDYVTFYRTFDNKIWVCCGCFCGPLGRFHDLVKLQHGDSIFATEYLYAIRSAIVHLNAENLYEDAYIPEDDALNRILEDNKY